MADLFVGEHDTGPHGNDDGATYEDRLDGFKSIVEANLVAGTTIQMHEDVGGHALLLTESGSAGNPVVFQGNPGAFWQNFSSVFRAIQATAALTDIHIFDMTFDNAQTDAITLTNNGGGVGADARYRIERCIITEFGDQGITTNGDDNIVRDNYLSARDAGSNDGITSRGARAVITGNFITNVGRDESTLDSDCIHVAASEDTYCAWNYCDHTLSTEKQAILCNSNRGMFCDNIALHKAAADGAAMGAFDDAETWSVTLTRNYCFQGDANITISMDAATVTANICADSTSEGIELTTAVESGDCNHNTIINSGTDGIDLANTAPTAINLYNNIVVEATGIGIDLANIGNTEEDNNCCYNNGTDFGQAAGSNSITTDPRLVDQAGGDYRLDGDSPCIGTGRDGLGGNGYDGLRFMSPPSMGAYEVRASSGYARKASAMPVRVLSAGVDIAKARAA